MPRGGRGRGGKGKNNVGQKKETAPTSRGVSVAAWQGQLYWHMPSGPGLT